MKKIRRIVFGGNSWSGNYTVEALVNLDEISSVTRVVDLPRGHSDGCVEIVMKNGEKFMAKGSVGDFAEE